MSSEGISQVFVTFVLEKDADMAAQEVRDKVNRILPDLPKDIEQPFVEKFDPDSIPVMTIAVSAPASIRDLTEYCDKVLRRQLESLPGVGQAMIVGGQKRQINVHLDGLKLRSPPPDRGPRRPGPAIAEPRGARRTVKAGQREYTLRTMGRVDSVAELGQIAVANSRRAHDHHRRPRPRRRRRRGGQEPGPLERHARRAAAHPQAVGHEHRRGRPAAQGAAGRACRRPPRRTTAFASSATNRVFIQAAVDTVKEHLTLGGVLAAVVIFFFLANIRTTLISALAIPTSIISAFAVVAYMGFTLNSITLLALALSVGIVIDDAIVVLENIYRFIEEKDCTPLGGRLRGDEGDRPGRPLHHAFAGGGLPADRLHGRDRGAISQVVRRHDGGHDPREHDHQLFAHADVGRPLAESEAAESRRRSAGGNGDGRAGAAHAAAGSRGGFYAWIERGYMAMLRLLAAASLGGRALRRRHVGLDPARC